MAARLGHALAGIVAGIGRSRGAHGRRRWYAKAAAIGGIAALGLSTGWFRYRDDLRWRVGELAKLTEVVPLSELRVCRCTPDGTVAFERADGLRIVGDLYRADSPGEAPGIVLVHGNTPLGGRLPYYGVLATGLAGRGYHVLAIDRTGYGRSDDPFRLGSIDALDHARDVRAAIEFLAAREGVADRIHLIGHSGGAASVFDAGLGHPAVDKVVAIGPSRRMAERLRDRRSREAFWERARRTHRRVYGHDLPGWYTEDVWRARAFEGDIARHIGELSDPCHTPLLLLDGEREAAADKLYLAGYADRIAEPKSYITIARSNHYANTMNFFWTVYDDRVVRRTVDAIVRWLRRPDDRAARCG